MDFTGYEERSYSERFAREDGSYIDIAACARKRCTEYCGNLLLHISLNLPETTLTIQGLLNGYSIQKDGAIIVADGIVVAVHDEPLWGRIRLTTKLFRQ